MKRVRSIVPDGDKRVTAPGHPDGKSPWIELTRISPPCNTAIRADKGSREGNPKPMGLAAPLSGRL